LRPNGKFRDIRRVCPEKVLLNLPSTFYILREIIPAGESMNKTVLNEVSGQDSFIRTYGIFFALAALLLIEMMPAQAGLPIAGQRMLGVLIFAVIVWMTEAITYEVSAIVIMCLIAILMGISPNPAKPEVLIGTVSGLTTALTGFSNPATALVAAAIFLSAAMMTTGLDKRIALIILSKVGGKTGRIVIGFILVSMVLSFFVPSTTARVACLVPIVMGIIRVFGISHKSALSGMLMIAIAQADTIWNVGLKTGAAQNFVAVGFIDKMLGVTVTWPQWLAAGFPFALVMSVVLYFVLMKVLKPEMTEIPGGQETIKKQLAELGPFTAKEARLLGISILLLAFWSTEKILHSVDSATITVIGVMLMLLPKIGVMSWQEAQPKIHWGTIALFGAGISLGTAILTTKAASWLASLVTNAFGLATMHPIGIIAIMGLFMIIIHLGFASATALASAMTPIVIAVLMQAQANNPSLNVVGITIIIHFTVCFGFILPVNAPQNMLAFSTGTFEASTFRKTGIPLAIIAYAMVLLFSVTYWDWIGLITK
jgi:solute carrier family 13 (sodium-dependent dicarboxylate transporter), member 2/3/5